MTTEFPMARRTDPGTSHLAAKIHTIDKLSERRKQVYYLVLGHPGSTSGELSRFMHKEYPDLPIRTAVETPHKRLPELEKLGLIERSAVKKCSDSGYQSLTWTARPIPIISKPEQEKLDL